MCVAGVHVWSPEWRVAALGNVATLPEARGRGLATAACADLCRLLLDDGIDVISLNVRADNLSAIRAYERLGFAHAADYVEVPLRSLAPGEAPKRGANGAGRLDPHEMPGTLDHLDPGARDPLGRVGRGGERHRAP